MEARFRLSCGSLHASDTDRSTGSARGLSHEIDRSRPAQSIANGPPPSIRETPSRPVTEQVTPEAAQSGTLTSQLLELLCPVSASGIKDKVTAVTIERNIVTLC